MKRLLISLLTIIPFLASAQDFEVAPVRVHFNASPGESQSRTVTVKNHSSRRETVTLRLQDFLIQRQGQMEILPAGSTRNSIASWVNLNPSFLTLEPNEAKTIQINLQAPNDNFTSKWGILSFSASTEQTAFSADRGVQAGLSLSGRIDIYLFYNPAASEPGRVEVSNLVETKNGAASERHFAVNVDNYGERITTGKVFLIASNIDTGFEKRYRTVDVLVYPQTTRTIELSIPKDLPPGRYSFAAILDYQGSTSLKGTQTSVIVD